MSCHNIPGAIQRIYVLHVDLFGYFGKFQSQILKIGNVHIKLEDITVKYLIFPFYNGQRRCYIKTLEYQHRVMGVYIEVHLLKMIMK